MVKAVAFAYTRQKFNSTGEARETLGLPQTFYVSSHYIIHTE